MLFFNRESHSIIVFLPNLNFRNKYSCNYVLVGCCSLWLLILKRGMVQKHFCKAVGEIHGTNQTHLTSSYRSRLNGLNSTTNHDKSYRMSKSSHLTITEKTLVVCVCVTDSDICQTPD